MNKNVIDPQNPTEDLGVDLGTGQLVSMKTVQQIYSEITGKSEKLERTYKINHGIGFDDLCQLNAKIQQLHEQYNIVSKNCAITLFHLDDQKQTYSSFERFQLFDRTTLSPVENIRLEYNFLIVLPQMRKPQSYEIEINIHSRATFVKRAKADPSFRSDMFYELFSPNTAHVEINFIDYTVARNFQTAINGWFKALPEIDSTRLLNPLKKLRGYYVFTFRFMSVSAYLLFCHTHFSKLLTGQPPSNASLFLASVVTFGGMFLLSILAGKLGSIASETVRRIQCKSYLNLTRGDEIALKELDSANVMAVISTVATVLIAVAANIFSTWLAIRIGIGP